MDSNSAPDKFQHVDILSFDGGGSRGIMEVSILRDVMRLATILWQEPKTLSYLTENLENVLESQDVLKDRNILKHEKVREKLVTHLENVSSPLHPTKIYDMIVGTSTGALIAFGLVGGKEEDGERVPMTLKECIDMYLLKTKEIFKKSLLHRIISYLPGLGSTPMTTYSQDNVKGVLSDQFGESCLIDFEKSNSVTCVAGAVARQIGPTEELVLFDTKNEAYKFYKTHQVLLASSNAPVYFETPVRIGSKEFVDGGVGGNCPLVQAIPRAKEIFADKAKQKITSVLSIAPPSPKKSDIPNRFQINYWLNYFVNQSTDGYAVYKDAEKRYKKRLNLPRLPPRGESLKDNKQTEGNSGSKDAEQRYNNKMNFRRLSPRGESLKDFKLDEIDAQKMLDAIKFERLNDDMFLVDVIATAAVVVDTYFGKAKESPEKTTAEMGAQLAQKAADIYADKFEYELALNSYETSISLWKKAANKDMNDVIVELYGNIAKCLKEQGKYQRAIEICQSIVNYWEKRNSTNLAKAKQDLARCLWSSYEYKMAEDRLKEALEILQKEEKARGERPTRTPEEKAREERPAKAKKASILVDLGWCQSQQGNFKDAVDSYLEAKALQKQIEVNQLEIAITQNCLGICYSELGNHQKAIKKIRKALNGRNERLSIAQFKNNLGWCLMGSNNFDDARVNLDESLMMKRELFGGVDNLSIAVTMENLAKCVCKGNQDGQLDPREYVQQALEIKKGCLGREISDNAGIAKTLSIAGLVFLKTGDSEKAEEFCRDSLKMTEILFGDDHPTLVDIFNCLGQSLVNQEKPEDAEDCFKKALGVAIRQQNPDLKDSIEKLLQSTYTA